MTLEAFELLPSSAPTAVPTLRFLASLVTVPQKRDNYGISSVCLATSPAPCPWRPGSPIILLSLCMPVAWESRLLTPGPLAGYCQGALFSLRLLLGGAFVTHKPVNKATSVVNNCWHVLIYRITHTCTWTCSQELQTWSRGNQGVAAEPRLQFSPTGHSGLDSVTLEMDGDV